MDFKDYYAVMGLERSATQDAFHGAVRSLSLKHSEVGPDGRPRVRERNLRVRIPKGVRQGQQIRLAGMALNWWAIGLLIFAPHISALAQWALSRTREYDADLNAARLSGDPQGLALALARIELAQGGWLENILLPGRRVPESSLLRTHPPVEERIRRLLSLAPQDTAFAPVQPASTSMQLGPAVSRLPGWHLTGLWH